MKVIYHCYGGSHSSVTAAAIHLAMLPESQRPTLTSLTEIPYYDGQVSKDHGIIRYMGNDVHGNQIYVLGRRNTAIITQNCLNGIAQLFGITPDELLLVDVMPYVNWMMMVGGYLSRRMGWVRIGRPIVVMGTIISFPKMVGLVQRIRLQVAGKGRPMVSNYEQQYDY